MGSSRRQPPPTEIAELKKLPSLLAVQLDAFPEKSTGCSVEQVCQGAKCENALNCPKNWILYTISYMNGYLAIDSGGHVYMHCLRTLIQ